MQWQATAVEEAVLSRRALAAAEGQSCAERAALLPLEKKLEPEMGP
jgi:hypothetical protein